MRIMMTRKDRNIAQEVDRSWYDEIAKRLPQIKVQSFCGPEATIRWLFNHVTIDPSSAELAEKLKRLEEEEKCSNS